MHTLQFSRFFSTSTQVGASCFPILFAINLKRLYSRSTSLFNLLLPFLIQRIWTGLTHSRAHKFVCVCIKGGFFSERSIHFLDLQISKKNYSKKLSWAWNLNFPANYSILLLAGNLNFKLRIVFWNIFFWDLEI